MADHQNDESAALCAECHGSGVETVMVDDDGAGDLCPVHDAHPRGQCGNGFPCSGWDGRPCALNRTDWLSQHGGAVLTTYDMEADCG